MAVSATTGSSAKRRKKGFDMKVIAKETYDDWRDQPILHDEDQWMGKYKTYGEMWAGEGYAVEQ